jgi:hypothetical protein
MEMRGRWFSNWFKLIDKIRPLHTYNSIILKVI